jgi:hypothetical protein
MLRTARRPRFRPLLEALEGRYVPSVVLFQDTFHTDANPRGGGWDDVNHALATARQSGVLTPIPYLEKDATASTGAFDALTQVNNPALPDALRLATEPVAGQNFTYVTPNQDFGDAGLGVQQLHVAIDPLGPDSSPATDHWAAVVFGASPGSFIVGSGTGVLVRDSGEYELWDRSKLLSVGQLAAKVNPQQFYSIDFSITPSTGQFTLAIDGQQLFTGKHGPYTGNFVTLEDFTTTTDSGTAVDYFADLSISGTARALPLVAQPDTSYYVSPQGNDSNAGTSPAAAWRTIAHVNQVIFRPGDQILFQGGATFAGNLAFDTQDIGLARAHITLGSFGNGPATIAAGTGAGIAINNASFFTIANLEVVGSGFLTNQSDGIRFSSDIPGRALFGFVVDHVDVSGFGQVGIDFLGSNNSRDFAHISVTDSSANDNGNGGVQVLAQGSQTASDITIDHVQAIRNAGSANVDSGYGILVFGASEVVIQFSVTGDNGWLPGNHGETGGIEAIADNRVLLQYNEAYRNHFGNSDGDGIILDVTNDSIMQFNYSHDNDGAGLFLFAETGARSTRNIIRYNISQNDARTQMDTYGGIFVGADVVDSDIYNNTIFMGPSPTSSPAAIRLLGLLGSSIHVRNNILVTTGGVPVVSWDGSGTDVLFQGNDYESGTSPFVILSNNVTYHTLAAWRTSTGEETLAGMPVGLRVDPRLNDAGHGGTIGNADLLDTLTAYQLRKDSPVAHAGLDLTQFKVMWDPYRYAGDSFLNRFFSPTPTDFYGDPLPAAGSGLLSIGAHQPGA